MADRRIIATTVSEIVNYWKRNSQTHTPNVDFYDAHERCWRCSYKTKLQKCHIVPHSLGGSDSPQNLVLLCRLCHEEGPNVIDSEIFWDWINAHNIEFYDAYWTRRGMSEYEYIYKKSLEEDLVELGITEPEQVSERFKRMLKKATWHWGHPRMNPATYAGIMRMVIKELQKEQAH